MDLNFATFLKYLLTNFMLWYCPTLCSQDMNVYLVFYAFTSTPLAANKEIVFLFVWIIFSFNELTLLA
jgi:hypothetical protein